ncbi:MAG: hypothetical protein K2H43_03505 [Clostridia bacterium]|nr:hypothetical protein [Clostridia bacterium]
MFVLVAKNLFCDYIVSSAGSSANELLDSMTWSYTPAIVGIVLSALNLIRAVVQKIVAKAANLN